MPTDAKSVWESIKAFMDSKFVALEPPYSPTLAEEIIAWFSFYLVEVANIVGILLEAPVVLFLFWEFTKKNSRFRNAYFIILSYGFFVDLVCFSPFWMSKKINFGENFLKAGFGIAEWYSDFWYCTWNMILAFNRATAVWLPFKHQQIWTMRRTFNAIVFITLFPLIINAGSFGEFNCVLLAGGTPQCMPYKVSLVFRSIIVNILCCVLVFFSVIVSLCSSKSVSEKNIQIERRLMAQSTVSAILLLGMFGCYSAGTYLASINVTWQVTGRIYAYGDICYIFQHFAGIAIIVIVCPPFRIGLIKFLSFGYIDLGRPKVRPSNSVSRF